MKFPRTWQDVHRAPWLDSTENYEDGIFLHVKTEWLPPGHEVSHTCSARGDSLREALAELRSDHWDWIRNPDTGQPVSVTPKSWPER